jgi:hypothetical protein
VTLPLHILAHVSEPAEVVTATLRWEEGIQLSGTFTTLPHPDGGGLLAGSLDWLLESQPPEPETQPATLALTGPAGAVLAQQELTVLSPNDPGVERIDLYWVLGEELQTEQRRIVAGEQPAATALEELLWGPPPRNLAGFTTALPTVEDVLAYSGREPDWDVRVTLRGLTVENGVAMADLSQEMRAYGGGSARVQTIRDQITRTLLQFPDINEVRIAVEGQTESVLQP